MNLYTVLKITCLLTLLVVVSAKGKKKRRNKPKINYCNPCDGKGLPFTQHPSPDTKDLSPPEKDDIIMNLYDIKDLVDQKLSTTKIILNASVPGRCRRNLIQKPQRGMKLARPNRGEYAHHVYVNITAIATDLKAVEEHSKVLFQDQIDDECGIDFSELDDEINKTLCKMRVLNEVGKPKSTIKCQRKPSLRKYRKDKDRQNFVLCGLRDASEMLEEMILLLEICKVDKKGLINCPNLARKKGRKDKKKNKRRRRKGRKGRKTPGRRRKGKKTKNKNESRKQEN